MCALLLGNEGKGKDGGKDGGLDFVGLPRTPAHAPQLVALAVLGASGRRLVTPDLGASQSIDVDPVTTRQT